MRALSYIFCCFAAVLMLGPAGFAQMPEAPQAKEDKGPARVKHEESWWSRTRPDQKEAAKQLEYAESLKAAGHKRKAMKVYRDLVYAWPQSLQAPVAQLNYAQLLEQNGDLTKAFDEYQFLIETYPGFFPYQEALERQFKIADKLAGRNRYFLLFRYQSPEDAIPLFEKMIQSGLQWKRSSELQFRIARIYEKTEQYDLAIDAYTAYHQRYPMGPLAEQSAFGQAKCCYLYSKKNRNAANLRENAIATLKGFLQWYPQSDMLPQARRYLKEIEMEAAQLLYEQSRIYLRASYRADDGAEEKKCLDGARISFQRLIYEFPSSRWADTARARIRQIDERLGELQ